jgi:tetratricopeptide (TPR) repeat protein
VGLDVLFHSARALGDQAAALRAAGGLKDTSKGRELAGEVSNEGVAAARDGDLDLAKRSYELAIAMDSQAAAPLANLAIIRHFEGQPQESLELLDRLLELAPKEPNGLEYRYLNLCALDEEDKADKAFEALREVDPQRAAKAAFKAGDTLFDADKMAGAVASYERFVKLAPDHAPVHHQLGLCYVNLGQLEKAREHLERFVKLAPNDPQTSAVEEMLKALK